MPRELANYRLVDLPPGNASVIRAWFAGMDAEESTRCLLCGTGFRRGLYAWACPPCQVLCGHQDVAGVRRAGDGALHPCRRCLNCGLGSPGPRKGERLPNVVIRDTLVSYPAEPCARCGDTTGSQLHHWAPTAIFDDAERWPTDWLCRSCHQTWHQAMRAAGGWRLDAKVSAALDGAA